MTGGGGAFLEVLNGYNYKTRLKKNKNKKIVHSDSVFFIKFTKRKKKKKIEKKKKK